MPKKKPISSDEPIVPRPHRNMRAKIVFDPSDNYLPKKRKKLSSKSEKLMEPSIIKKTTNDKKQETKYKSHLENELIDCRSNEIITIPEHSPSKSPVRCATPVIFQEVPDTCFICSKDSPNKELVDCPVCMVRAHRDCLIIIEPMWKFKLDSCPWLCKQCRKKHCRKCLADESQWEISRRCITCKIGLHVECYESYEIKPLHKVKTDMYICIPCMTLATQRVPGVEKEEEFSDDSLTPNFSSEMSGEDDEDFFYDKPHNSSVVSQNSEKKPPEFRKLSIPNVTKWDKYQVYDYLVKRLPAEIAVKVIEKNIDGSALHLLQRTDVTLNMGLKLGYAMKLYKQVRILQAQSTYYSVFWE